MIHYSCDRCQRLIETDDEMRYVVRLQIQAVFAENSFSADEDDADQLLQIHETLERQVEEDLPGDEDLVHRRQRFDLCADCYHAYLRNPMGQEVNKPVDFSQN